MGQPIRERLQGPKRHLSPDGGKRVGGVSGRPTQEGGRSDPFDRLSSQRWKASGPQDGGALRGVSLERRPRSVRHVRRGSSSACGRTGDKGCSSDAEEGNDVSSRPKMRGHSTRGQCNALALEDASFARSGGPCTSIVAQLAAAKPSRGHADSGASRSGKPGQPGRTGTEVLEDGRSAARRVRSSSQEEVHRA